MSPTSESCKSNDSENIDRRDSIIVQPRINHANFEENKNKRL